MPPVPLQQQQFPCMSCGAKLEFNPLLGDLACPYCGHTEAVPEADQDAPEQAFAKHDLSDSVKLARLSEQSFPHKKAVGIARYRPSCHLPATFPQGTGYPRSNNVPRCPPQSSIPP